MAVDTNISDLFFNYDSDEDITIKDSDGNFAKYDTDKLCYRANTFLGCLQRLGVDTPSSDELIQDFYSRI